EVLIGAGGAILVFLYWIGFDLMPFVLIAGVVAVLFFVVEQRGQGRRFEILGGGMEGGEGTGVTFDDIGGQEVAKREFLEALEFVRKAPDAERLGIRPLRGILLTGPPGTGKTLLAKAAAG